MFDLKRVHCRGTRGRFLDEQMCESDTGWVWLNGEGNPRPARSHSMNGRWSSRIIRSQLRRIRTVKDDLSGNGTRRCGAITRLPVPSGAGMRMRRITGGAAYSKAEGRRASACSSFAAKYSCPPCCSGADCRCKTEVRRGRAEGARGGGGG
jgi:hypothetical protein